MAVRSSETEASAAELVQDLGLTENDASLGPASQLASLASLESIRRMPEPPSH
jgi:hypothetical protein